MSVGVAVRRDVRIPVWALALQVAAAAAAIAAVTIPAAATPRAVATAYLMLIAPGLAVALPMQLPSAEVKVLLGLTVSVVADILAAQLVVRLSGLEPDYVLAGVGAVTAWGLTVQLTRVQLRRQPRPRTGGAGDA